MLTTTFNINLSRAKALLFYKAQKNRVVVNASNGQRLSVPWQLLQPYVTEGGISGRFEISFDDNGKCLSLNPI